MPRLEHTCLDGAGTVTSVPSATVSSGTTPEDNVLMCGPGSTQSATILQNQVLLLQPNQPLLIPPRHILLRTQVLTTVPDSRLTEQQQQRIVQDLLYDEPSAAAEVALPTSGTGLTTEDWSD